MKLSQYYAIKKPTYQYYKITPLKSLRNYQSDKLIEVFAHLSENIRKSFEIEDKKFLITCQSKFAYLIHIKKSNVEFYFIIPDYYEKLMLEKIKNCWKGITIDKVDNIPQAYEFNYYLEYAKNYCLSLATDKRKETLLKSLCNVSQILTTADAVNVFYNFNTCEQKYLYADHKNTIKKYNNGYNLKVSPKDILLKLIDTLLRVVFTILSIKEEKQDVRVEPLSNDTMRKRDGIVIDTQILVSGTNKTACMAVCEAYKCISQDNELRYRKTANKINYEKYFLPVPKNRMSCREVQNFIALPGKEIIEEYKIKCIDTFESKAPEELKKGIVKIGDNLFRGTATQVFLSNDTTLRNLPLCVTGSNQSGKSTYLTNLSKDYIDNGECVILFDFCGVGELTRDLAPLFDNKLIIDCSDSHNLQGLGYNEIKPSTDTFEQYRNAKMQSIQLSTLVNACNEEDKNLKAKMDRYLEASALVVFINNGSIKNVFEVLMFWEIRHKFIERVPKNQLDNLSEYISFLYELDETNKQGEVTGTVYRKIEGIIDRLNALKKNTYIELMLKKSCEGNFNLLEEIQKPQLICIKMPEVMFATSQEKDIFCTYWFTKLWLALQIRKNETEQRTKVNILIDELYQVEKCQDLVSQKLSQMPKFTAKLIVSCHYLDQIKQLREELKACNSSYMILQGSNVSNFDSLKLEFENQGFSVDDLLNLKRYNSLNLISYEKGYWAGITQLPPPIK